MVLFTTFLFCMYILQKIFLSDKRIEKRVQRYLQQSDKEILESKKFRLALQFMQKRNSIKNKLLTKEKNSKLESLLTQAGLPLKPEEYIMFQGIATILGTGLFFLLFENVFIMIIGGIFGFLLPKIIVRKKINERLKKFQDSLPEMISTIVGALRAGFSFPQALNSVMEEAQSPVKEEISIVLKEMQYGTSVEEALNNLKERMPSEDLDIMIQAIVIQRQVGGNLATVLETIVDTIRDRIKIQGQISTLTAQGRMSGWVLGLLPIFVGVMIYFVEPSYMSVLFMEPIGIILLIIAAISCFIGFMLIRKLTSIEV